MRGIFHYFGSTLNGKKFFYYRIISQQFARTVHFPSPWSPLLFIATADWVNLLVPPSVGSSNILWRITESHCWVFSAGRWLNCNWVIHLSCIVLRWRGISSVGILRRYIQCCKSYSLIWKASLSLIICWFLSRLPLIFISLRDIRQPLKAVTGLYLTCKVRSLGILSFSTVFDQSWVSFWFPIWRKTNNQTKAVQCASSQE